LALKNPKVGSSRKRKARRREREKKKKVYAEEERREVLSKRIIPDVHFPGPLFMK
jgi:hypothetical protein